MDWRNLAPTLVRQCIMIEGISDHVISPEEIKAYLFELSKVVQMKALRAVNYETQIMVILEAT